jgi:hypothetical protein
MVPISPGTVSMRADYTSTVYTGLHVHKTIISTFNNTVAIGEYQSGKIIFTANERDGEF